MQKDQLLFISHSKNDDKIALALCDYLESNGLHCWIAPRDNFAGKLYGASIIEGINFSKIMIVILSKSSNNSDSVISEVERAFDKKIDLVTFKIDKTVISSSLEFFLSSKQWLDVSNGNPKSYFPEVHRICKGLLNNDTVNVVTKPTQNKFGTFVKSNKMVLLISFILGLGFLVYSFVRTDFETIKNKPNKDPIVKDSDGSKFKNDETAEPNSQPTKKVSEEPKPTIIPPIKVNEEDLTTKEPVSSAQLESNDLDNVRFISLEDDNKYIVFDRVKKGIYDFNGTYGNAKFAGRVKFIGNGTYEIEKSESIAGYFYVNEEIIRGNVTVYQGNITSKLSKFELQKK